MRYALRNKSRIVHHFQPGGEQILERILKSLDAHFQRNPVIEIEDADPYPVLRISEEGNTNITITFFLLGITFDVYRLAFKEFIQ